MECIEFARVDGDRAGITFAIDVFSGDIPALTVWKTNEDCCNVEIASSVEFDLARLTDRFDPAETSGIVRVPRQHGDQRQDRLPEHILDGLRSPEMLGLKVRPDHQVVFQGLETSKT